MDAMLATLERAAHLIGEHIERTAGELGITQAEAHVLAQLARRGSLPITTLHREFGHKRSTLTNILDRLEERELIRRELNRDDRRSFVIHLTQSGARRALRVRGVLDELEAKVREAVTDRDARGLDAIVEALEAILHRSQRTRRRGR